MLPRNHPDRMVVFRRPPPGGTMPGCSFRQDPRPGPGPARTRRPSPRSGRDAPGQGKRAPTRSGRLESLSIELEGVAATDLLLATADALARTDGQGRGRPAAWAGRARVIRPAERAPTPAGGSWGFMSVTVCIIRQAVAGAAWPCQAAGRIPGDSHRVSQPSTWTASQAASTIWRDRQRLHHPGGPRRGPPPRRYTGRSRNGILDLGVAAVVGLHPCWPGSNPPVRPADG